MKNKLVFLLFFFLLLFVSQATASLNNDLVSAWNFDEGTGTTAEDSFSNKDLTLSSAGWNTGIINDAYQGVAGRSASITDSTLQFNTTGNRIFTVSLWFRPSSITSGFQGIISTERNSNGQGWSLRSDNGNSNVYFRYSDGTIRDITKTSLSNDVWYHAVIGYDGTKTFFYIDGVSVGTQTFTAGAMSSSGTLAVGAYRGDDLSNNNWRGRVDAVQVWDRALTSSEITELYNSGDGLQYPFAGGFPVNISNTFFSPNETIYKTTSNFRGNVVVNDTLSDGLYINYTYFVNDVAETTGQYVLAPTGNTYNLPVFSLSTYDQGDNITFSAFAVNSSNTSQVLSSTVTSDPVMIANQLPSIDIYWSSLFPLNSTNFTGMSVYGDPDLDPVNISWSIYKNDVLDSSGSLLNQNIPFNPVSLFTIDASTTQVGDVYRFNATISDGIDTATATSLNATVTDVLNWTVIVTDEWTGLPIDDYNINVEYLLDPVFVEYDNTIGTISSDFELLATINLEQTIESNNIIGSIVGNGRVGGSGYNEFMIGYGNLTGDSQLKVFGGEATGSTIYFSENISLNTDLGEIDKILILGRRVNGTGDLVVTNFELLFNPLKQRNIIANTSTFITPIISNNLANASIEHINEGAGIVSGGVTIENQGMKFDGTTGKVTTGITSNDYFQESFTLEAWVNITGAGEGNNGRIFSKVNPSTTGSSGGFHLLRTSESRLSFGLGNAPAVTTPTNSFLNNNIYHVIMVLEDNGLGGSIITFYINGVLNNQHTISTRSTADITNSNLLTLGANSGGNNRYFDGTIYAARIYDRKINSTEITTLYNAGRTAISPITNGLVSEWNGQNYIGIPAKPLLIREEITKSYFNKSFINVPLNTTLLATLHQSVASFTARELITNNVLSGVTYIIDGKEGTIFNISATNHSVTTNKTGYYPLTTSITTTPLTSQNFEITGLYNQLLTLTAKHAIDNASINNFNVTIKYATYEATYSTTNGTIIAPVLQGLPYTITFSTPGDFATRTYNVTTTSTPTFDLEAVLYSFNSLLITFRNSNNQSIINNVTLSYFSDLDSNTTSTTTGEIYLTLLNPVSYIFQTSAQGYLDNFFFVSVTNDSADQFTIYLNDNTTDIIKVTVIDGAGSEVEGAEVRVLKHFIATNTYELVSSGLTDPTGSTNVQANKNSGFYRFQVLVDGVLRKTTDPFVITGDIINIQIFIVDDYLSLWNELKGIDYFLTFNDATNNFRLEYSTSTPRTLCLDVVRELGSNNVPVDTVCSTGTTGTILIPVDNITGSVYVGRASTTIGGEPVNLATFRKQFLNIGIGTSGLIFQILLTTLFVFVGVSVGASLLFITVPLSLIIGGFVGLHSISFAYTAPILIVGIIIMYLVRDR
jgi:hypothetical protein